MPLSPHGSRIGRCSSPSSASSSARTMTGRRRSRPWTIPTLLIVGDADMVRTAHAVEFFALLGGGQRDAGWDGAGRPASQLAILPGVTHYDIFMRAEITAAVTPFLDAPLAATP